MVWACSMFREKRFEWENLEGKRPHGLPRHVWEGSVKLDLEQMGWEGLV